MKFLSAIASLSALALGSAMLAQEQQPLQTEELNLISELKRAEIIPTVFNAFKPFLKLEASWKHASADVGNTVTPSKLQTAPHVKFVGSLPDMFSPPAKDGVPQLTLALTDPDAPSRDDPQWSQICHWLATDIQLTTSGTVHQVEHFVEIVPYKPPGPPPKTGKHRYVFAALAPLNGTTEKLNLSKPADRQHWGFDDERQGLRDWAEENGLGVVGANFIYSQNKKQ